VRVFVAVQPTPRSGASSLSRYIAQSKVDREREQVDEKGSRPLFSERDETLTYSAADRILNPTSGELEKEDVIHVVVSPEQGTFERVGETVEERKQSFMEAIRDVMRTMARELKVRFLNWVGGIHGNTRTPHGHLAVSRWALDETTGKLVYIKHLPESLLPRNLEGDDGTKRFSTGKIAEVFAESLDRRQKPVRFFQMQHIDTGVEISRSILSPYAVMLREPTSEERLVGRWIEAELTLARSIAKGWGGQDELVRHCVKLRGGVAELDAMTRAQSARPTAAYVEPERLEELMRGHTGDLRVNVFTKRPQSDNEKCVERTVEQPGIRADEKSLSVQQTFHHGEAKVSISALPLERSPATEAEGKLISPRQTEGVRPGRAPSAGARISRVGKIQTASVEAREKLEPTLRVATKTLAQLRSHVLLSHNSKGAIEETTEACEVIKHHHHEHGNRQIASKDGQPEARPPFAIPTNRASPTSRGNLSDPPGTLPGTNPPLRESRLSDIELSHRAHMVGLNRLFMERERDILREATTMKIEQIQLNGDRDRSRAEATLEPLYSFQSKVREAILLDNIYDDVRRKRNIPRQRLSETQEDLLKGSDSWLVTQLKNSLLDEMELAKEQIVILAPLANPTKIKEYNKYQEEQHTLAALAQARERQTTASSKNERSTAPTLEHDSHSIILAQPGKETTPSEALIEKAIELLL
jgi:hypothetical protein